MDSITYLIIQLCHHGVKYLYAPKDLIAGTYPLSRQIEIRELSGTLYLPEAHNLKIKLLDQFLAVIDEVKVKFGLSNLENYEFLLRDIVKKHQFHNFRDVFRSIGVHELSGTLFRSATLSKWTGTKEIQRLTAANNISDIVDLRNQDEISKSPYSQDDLGRTGYHHVPLKTPDFLQPPEEWIGFYDDNHEEIVRVISLLIEAKKGVLVHCHIGRDRTGWLILLILSGLGIDSEEIISDYRSSLMRTENDPIEKLIPFVQEWLVENEVVQGLLLEFRNKLKA